MKVLDVRRVGFAGSLPDDTRSPESFAFPACLTSLVEYIGADVRWRTVRAHGREWTERFLYKELLAASGMSFGLLWHPRACLSCTDLTQVHTDHNDAIRLAFDYAGYEYKVIARTEDNGDLLRKRIVTSVNRGVPVLAFGIVGPPECAIVCGYDGRALLGWSHHDEGCDHAANGMFSTKDWRHHLWKVVLCGRRKPRSTDLAAIVRRGLAVMRTREVGGYLAGDAAYDAWMAYIQDEAYDTMDDERLRERHRLHHALVGNHAEARAYLSDVLSVRGADATPLRDAARCFMDIHDTCWRVWDVLGGHTAPGAHRGLRDAGKRAAVARLLATMKDLDRRAADALYAWLPKSY